MTTKEEEDIQFYQEVISTYLDEALFYLRMKATSKNITVTVEKDRLVCKWETKTEADQVLGGVFSFLKTDNIEEARKELMLMTLISLHPDGQVINGIFTAIRNFMHPTDPSRNSIPEIMIRWEMIRERVEAEQTGAIIGRSNSHRVFDDTMHIEKCLDEIWGLGLAKRH